MTAKLIKKPRVEIFPTSARLADALRKAVKRNRRLALGTTVHHAGQAGASVAHQGRLVVLSHADEVDFDGKARCAEMLNSAAFHLLFTAPTTHPDQVVQWMRANNIRSESRLHVARVESLDAPEFSNLLLRISSAFEQDDMQGRVIDAYVVGNTLHVRGPKHRMLNVPFASLPSLRGQPRAILDNFQIDPDGAFLYWPDLDAHLGWNQFLQAVDPADLRKAQQRSADFNRRYGAAIRKVREAAGMTQTQIDGLTDRQLRRIEHGDSRATASALIALAKAHGLDANVYLDKLATALE